MCVNFTRKERLYKNLLSVSLDDAEVVQAERDKVARRRRRLLAEAARLHPPKAVSRYSSGPFTEIPKFNGFVLTYLVSCGFGVDVTILLVFSMFLVSRRRFVFGFLSFLWHIFLAVVRSPSFSLQFADFSY